MAKCKICDKEIVLIPSAKDRSDKYGNTPEHYINLFKTHSKCLIDKRNKEVNELVRRKPYG